MPRMDLHDCTARKPLAPDGALLAIASSVLGSALRRCRGRVRSVDVYAAVATRLSSGSSSG